MEQFGHSPTSFKAMWEEVFTQLVGEEFVKSYIVINVSLRDSGAYVGHFICKGQLLLAWSLKYVEITLSEGCFRTGH